MEKRLLLLACLAIAMSTLAWVVVRPPDSGPPVAEVIRNAPEPAAPVQPSPDLARPLVAERAPAPSVATPRSAEVPELPDTDVALALGVGVKGEPLERYDAAAARARHIADSVEHVLSSVAPELDMEAVTRSCSDDGGRCTFEGPWPGDDFLGRWVRAISDGEVAVDLEGVTFRSFEPVEGADGARTFRIVAVGPPEAP